MHRITKGALLTLVGLSLVTPVSAQDTAPPPNGTAIVFVNTQAILPVAPGADSAQAQFQRVLQGFTDELAGLETELQTMMDDYRQQEALLDDAGRTSRQEAILDKQRQAQQREAELQGESDRRRNELLAPILQNVTNVIEEIRAEYQYSMVFDIAESGVVAADTSLDITTLVLERLGIDPSSLVSPTGN